MIDLQKILSGLRIIGLFAFAMMPGGIAAPEAGAQVLNVNVVKGPAFCRQVRHELLLFGEGIGLARPAAARLAALGSPVLIASLRNVGGRYIDVEKLLQAAGIPGAGGGSYVGLGTILAPVFGAPLDLGVSLKVRDWRVLPHAQPQVDSLLVAREAEELTVDRARRIALAALQAGIRLHAIWIPDAQRPSQEPALLMATVAATGGTFVDLSQPVTGELCLDLL